MARLAYTLGEEAREPIILENTLDHSRPGLCGQRWYFRCPAPAEDGVCARRVGKLYLPPVGVLFACRECHRLTYHSCQGSRRPPSEAGMRRYAERVIRDRGRSKSGAIARATTSR